MGIGTDARVTYRRKHSYNTRSNKIRKFRTPGGKISVKYSGKYAKGPTCKQCRKAIQGIPRARPTEYSNMKKSERTISRTYGGVLCAGCCKDRILHAFLVEEGKEMKKKLKLSA